MFVVTNENYVDINDISAITKISSICLLRKVYYAFYVILKNGKEIEISAVDKNLLEKERMRFIESVNESKGQL